MKEANLLLQKLETFAEDTGKKDTIRLTIMEDKDILFRDDCVVGEGHSRNASFSCPTYIYHVTQTDRFCRMPRAVSQYPTSIRSTRYFRRTKKTREKTKGKKES